MLWTDSDRIDALVWQEVDDEPKCPGCNQPVSESFHPENEDHYEVRRMVCHSCRAKAQAEEKLENPDSRRWMFFIPELDEGGVKAGGDSG